MDRWIEKQFPNKGPNPSSRRGLVGGRGDSRGSRDRSGRKRADKDGGGGGGGRGKADCDDGGKGPEGGEERETLTACP